MVPIQVIADLCRPAIRTAGDAATIDRRGDYALVIESYALATHGEVPRVVPTCKLLEALHFFAPLTWMGRTAE